MRRAVAITFAASAAWMISVTGCGDDKVKPGDLTVNWSHGPTATCEGRSIVEIQARALRKGELEATATGPCPATSRQGNLVIPDLRPGSYEIQVEAFDATGKGLYLGTALNQSVKEGGATETTTITLTQKPVRLNVTWRTPSGMCAGSDVRDVLVQYIPDASSTGAVEYEETVPCNNEVQDPDDPENLLAGVLITDLEPNDDVVVFVFGLNSAGDEIASGESGTLDLQAGDDQTILIDMTTCPGTPPNCG